MCYYLQIERYSIHLQKPKEDKEKLQRSTQERYPNRLVSKRRFSTQSSTGITIEAANFIGRFKEV